MRWRETCRSHGNARHRGPRRSGNPTCALKNRSRAGPRSARNSNCGFSPITFSDDRQTRACQESCWWDSFGTALERRGWSQVGFILKRSCSGAPGPPSGPVKTSRAPPNAAAARRHGIRIGNGCSVIALPPLPRRRGDDSNAPFCRPRSGPAGKAPVAQLDRAPDYESGGQEFESLRARHCDT